MLANAWACVMTVVAVCDVKSARLSGDVYFAVACGNWPRMMSRPSSGIIWANMTCSPSIVGVSLNLRIVGLHLPNQELERCLRIIGGQRMVGIRNPLCDLSVEILVGIGALSMNLVMRRGSGLTALRAEAFAEVLALNAVGIAGDEEEPLCGHAAGEVARIQAAAQSAVLVPALVGLEALPH